MKHIHNAGFTLVEMLVAVALAGIVVSVLLGAFVTFLQYQVASQDERSALESVRFMLSNISREVHFGYNYACGKTVGTDCTCIAFTDQIGQRVKVRHEGTAAEKSVMLLDTAPDTCGASDPWVPLTDDAVTVNSLVFEILGGANEQSQVKMKTEVSYTADDEVRSAVLKTQITRRILDATQAIAGSFSIGEQDDVLGGLLHYIYTKKGVGNNYVCRDENGNEYPEDTQGNTPCDRPVTPIVAEFTDEALYVLGDNGLLFAVPIAGITGTNGVLKATGDPDGVAGTEVAKNIQSSTIESTAMRVIGKGGSDGCRQCDNDPVHIVSLYPSKRVLYALSNNGALYAVEKDGSIFTGTRLLSGGVSVNLVRNLTLRRIVFSRCSETRSAHGSCVCTQKAGERGAYRQ